MEEGSAEREEEVESRRLGQHQWNYRRVHGMHLTRAVKGAQSGGKVLLSL